MKKIILFAVISIVSATAVAQNNVGIGIATPAASSILDISSTSKGLLIPRMTSAQRNAITSPAKGLMVFDNETNSFWYYNGSAWSTLTASASLTLPFQQSVTYGGYAFDITNLGTGGALKGVSNTASGIGVYGESLNGNAVKGYSSNAGSIGVFGSSLAGTGVKATSFTGIALDVFGKVKISGGNTNPTAGAVLTSDAEGNAVWKSQKIAFTAKREVSQNLPFGFARLIFDNAFDAGDGFHSNGSATDPNIFVAPVSGYYYFSASAWLRITSATTNIFDATILIGHVGASNALILGKANQAINSPSYSDAFVQAHGGVHLSAGAKIEVLALANNTSSLPSVSLDNRFSGHLVYAD